MSTFGDFAILGTTILAAVLLIYRLKHRFGLLAPEEGSIKRGGENAPKDGKNTRSIDPWDDEIEYEPGLQAVPARKTANLSRRANRKYCKRVLKNLAGVEKA